MLNGQHVVIQGPPGTGKSQTIANVIGAAAADGKRVLFVTEKRAAIEAVTERLAEVGLAELELDLHAQRISRQEVAQQVAKSLDLLGSAMPPTWNSYTVDSLRPAGSSCGTQRRPTRSGHHGGFLPMPYSTLCWECRRTSARPRS